MQLSFWDEDYYELSWEETARCNECGDPAYTCECSLTDDEDGSTPCTRHGGSDGRGAVPHYVWNCPGAKR